MASFSLPDWLRTRSAAVALFGFALSLISSFGAAFWLNPAQDAKGYATRSAVAEASRSRAILAANATDGLAQHMGGLVFGVSVPKDASDTVAEAIHEIRLRELERRHDGIRAYLAELGVAGAIDYPTKLAEFNKLAAAEKQDFKLATYQAVNAFEGTLATEMVKAQGLAAMKADTLHRDRIKAESDVGFRKLVLLAVSLLGSSILFIAAMAGAGPKVEDDSPALRILRRAQTMVAARDGEAA